MAKHYLYVTRCLAKVVSHTEFKRKIELTRRYELYYAIYQGKLNKHLRKWCCIENNKVKYNESGLEDSYVESYMNQMQETVN